MFVAIIVVFSCGAPSGGLTRCSQVQLVSTTADPPTVSTSGVCAVQPSDLLRRYPRTTHRGAHGDHDNRCLAATVNPTGHRTLRHRKKPMECCSLATGSPYQHHCTRSDVIVSIPHLRFGSVAIESHVRCHDTRTVSQLYSSARIKTTQVD